MKLDQMKISPRNEIFQHSVAGMTLLAFLLTQLAWPLPVSAQDALRQQPSKENRGGLEELTRRLKKEEQGSVSIAPVISSLSRQVAAGMEEDDGILEETVVQKLIRSFGKEQAAVMAHEVRESVLSLAEPLSEKRTGQLARRIEPLTSWIIFKYGFPGRPDFRKMVLAGNLLFPTVALIRGGFGPNGLILWVLFNLVFLVTTGVNYYFLMEEGPEEVAMDKGFKKKFKKVILIKKRSGDQTQTRKAVSKAVYLSLHPEHPDYAAEAFVILRLREEGFPLTTHRLTERDFESSDLVSQFINSPPGQSYGEILAYLLYHLSGKDLPKAYRALLHVGEGRSITDAFKEIGFPIATQEQEERFEKPIELPQPKPRKAGSIPPHEQITDPMDKLVALVRSSGRSEDVVSDAIRKQNFDPLYQWAVVYERTGGKEGLERTLAEIEGTISLDVEDNIEPPSELQDDLHITPLLAAAIGIQAERGYSENARQLMDLAIAWADPKEGLQRDPGDFGGKEGRRVRSKAAMVSRILEFVGSLSMFDYSMRQIEETFGTLNFSEILERRMREYSGWISGVSPELFARSAEAVRLEKEFYDLAERFQDSKGLFALRTQAHASRSSKIPDLAENYLFLNQHVAQADLQRDASRLSSALVRDVNLGQPAAGLEELKAELQVEDKQVTTTVSAATPAVAAGMEEQDKTAKARIVAIFGYLVTVSKAIRDHPPVSVGGTATLPQRLRNLLKKQPDIERSLEETGVTTKQVNALFLSQEMDLPVQFHPQQAGLFWGTLHLFTSLSVVVEEQDKIGLWMDGDPVIPLTQEDRVIRALKEGLVGDAQFHPWFPIVVSELTAASQEAESTRFSFNVLQDLVRNVKSLIGIAEGPDLKEGSAPTAGLEETKAENGRAGIIAAGLEERRAIRSHLQESLMALGRQAPQGIAPIIIGPLFQEMDSRSRFLAGLEEQGIYLYDGKDKVSLFSRIITQHPEARLLRFAGLEEETRELLPLVSLAGMTLQVVWPTHDLSSLISQMTGLEEAFLQSQADFQEFQAGLEALSSGA